MRPLDRLPSIKWKLGVVIVAAVGVTVLVVAGGVELGVPLAICGLVAGALDLLMVQLLARGMTSPLREMALAARAMARGDHDRRVTATSSDEVGELARAFNTMAAELAEVDRMRRDLVANVSHELRTPITALQATLENIADGVEAPEPETLEAMRRQVQRLGRLVAQLLDLSRLEADADPLSRRSFGVLGLLEEAARDVTADVRVSVDPPRLEGWGDPERLHQVVANLLENAARHSPPGAAIELRARPEGRGIRVEVVDSGPGIPVRERTRVFERFHRVDSARSSAEGGTGLGLAISRWIVDLHGGQIRVEDAEPHGCRMVVTVPGPA